jgi:glycosyltransferase involved in cell wall biosynthesis
MRVLSVVIPALNEAENIAHVLAAIPHRDLRAAGWRTEVVVVDNGSSDGTAAIARAHGAQVLVQPVRGYGNAYKLGFANCTGDVIATGDADLTYPFADLPRLLASMDAGEIDFLSTNRLHSRNRDAMKMSHFVGNFVLSAAATLLFRSPFKDSQSGMWIFRRAVWESIDVRSGGMAFSQELKHEAHFMGFRCLEEAITYGVRGGEVKLNAMRDGVGNALQILTHRLRVARARRNRIISLPTDLPAQRSDVEVLDLAQWDRAALADGDSL